jgi:hypothetical protein
VVRLVGARIGGQLNCSGARLSNESGPALLADRIQVAQAVHLDEGFTAEGAGEDGTVRLIGARVGGRLSCSGAQLSNTSGPALHADGIQVDEDVFLDDGFTAEGAGEDGTVRLLGARIGGQLNCRGARLRNESGTALDASQLVTAHAFLDSIAAEGGGVYVTLDLSEVKISGQLSLVAIRLKHSEAVRRLNLDGLVYSGIPTTSSDWWS